MQPKVSFSYGWLRDHYECKRRASLSCAFSDNGLSDGQSDGRLWVPRSLRFWSIRRRRSDSAAALRTLIRKVALISHSVSVLPGSNRAGEDVGATRKHGYLQMHTFSLINTRVDTHSSMNSVFPLCLFYNKNLFQHLLRSMQGLGVGVQGVQGKYGSTDSELPELIV